MLHEASTSGSRFNGRPPQGDDAMRGFIVGSCATGVLLLGLMGLGGEARAAASELMQAVEAVAVSTAACGVGARYSAPG